MTPIRFAAAVTVLCSLGAAGCGAQPEPSPPSSPGPGPVEKPKITSLLDARLIGLGTRDLWNWELLDRTVTKDFQEFGVRPVDENELPRGCNGCGERPATAIVTVYTAEGFDPAEARKGQPVGVNGGEGFFRPAEGTGSADLAWQYADNMWATINGTTTQTSRVETLVRLAADLRPSERTPIRLPLRFAHVPETLPLASIKVQSGRWPTLIGFDKCPQAAVGCTDDGDALSVAIWPTDGYSGHIDENGAVAMTIGGKDGLYNDRRNEAVVQVKPGMLVSFELSGPQAVPPGSPTTDLKSILTGVEWASDPGSERTWADVSDWTKN